MRTTLDRRASPATIAGLELYSYTLTYAHGDYVMSGGRVIDRLESSVVRVITADGTEGYGEACPLGSTYLPAFAEGAQAAIRRLGPALVGADATDLAGIHRRMDGALSGSGYAKSAIDMACWDIMGRRAGLPLATLLGGRAQEALPLYVAVPLSEPARMRAFVERERAAGIHHFQIKVGGIPEADAERVAAIVDATGPEDALLADANGGWRVQDAVMAARLLEASPRLRLEQPCPTLEECLVVRTATTLPMVLDEVIVDLADLVRAASLGAMTHVNLKIGRVGGLTKARTIRDAAVALGLTLTIEDSWGGDIVTAAVAHLAAAVPPRQLFAVSFMNDWTREHIAGYQPRSVDGRGPIPTGPGLGIDVDLGQLGAPIWTVGA